MAPKKRTIRASPTITTNITPVTNAQLKALIDQGVADALAARDADRSQNGDDSLNSGTGSRRIERTARECTYTDFLKCQPMNFKVTKGVVGLTQWFERIETVFNISNCAVENQTVGQDAAHSMPCNTLMQMLGLPKELDLLCGMMFPEESVNIEKYVGGLPNMIHGSVMASKPKTMQDAVEFATELMDKKIRTFAEFQTKNKIKFEDTSRNNQNQQQQNKRQNTGRAYTDGPREKKPYRGSKTLCSKCNYHHDGPCAPKCHKCNRVGHLARDCRIPTNANTANNQRGTRAGQKATRFECGAQGHFKRECPKLKNNKRGNQGGNDTSKSIRGGQCGDKPGLQHRHVSQIDITPTTLDHFYDVELSDGKIIGLNTIIRGCILIFLNHSFNIELMPVELSSFDAIIGMDWLAKYQAIIVYVEKIVRIPWGNETLIVHGDESDRGNETRLNIISCTKMQKYMIKGCHVFLAHVTTKKTEDKSEGKRLKDVSNIHDFLEVFPEDF
ncbi:putative reverse transcriptase domain-containing protein [Tanacetum coccineum]